MKKRRAQQWQGDAVTVENSTVILINSTRLVHLVSLLPLTYEPGDKGIRSADAYRIFNEAAGYLALKHFNERNPRVLKDLPAMIGGCNMQMTVEMRDTRKSQRDAVLQFQEAYSTEHSIDHPVPFALLGAALSSVSKTLSILGAVYELPQMSSSSTSAELDDKLRFPSFTRTAPTNAADAEAIAVYFDSLHVPLFGVLYARDSYGLPYFEDLDKASDKWGIEMVAAAYNVGDDSSITDAAKRLQKAGVRYIVGILHDDTWKTVIRESISQGIIGSEGYTWFFADARSELTADFSLDRTTDGDVAEALHGAAVVQLHIPRHESFDYAFSEFETNKTLQQEFVSHHVEPEMFRNFSWVNPGFVNYQYLTYDAVMALGIAACNAEADFFNSSEMHESLLYTEFEGVSGYVAFDHVTGTRKPIGLQYQIENLLHSEEKSNNVSYGFTSHVSVFVDFAAEPPVQEIFPYVYYDNSTTQPSALPAVAEEPNLISGGALAMGLLLGCLAMCMALGWLVWTIVFRKTDIVRVSQPIFLSQLCVGTFVIATSVIPMSFQEPLKDHVLDFACMATPWLQSLGFVTAFSALFSKTWRLNKLFGHGRGFRRIEVKARDVMLPFIILLVLNVGLLTLWSIVAPLQWERTELENYDQFGRSVETFGSCHGSGTEQTVQRTCTALLILIDMAALVFANYQCYKARELPTDFNESFYIALSNASLLEALILGGPILMVVGDNPTANFLVKSLMVFIICLTIMLPVFIPKYLQKNIRKYRQEAGMSHRVSLAPVSSSRASFKASELGLRQASNPRVPPPPLYIEEDDSSELTGSQRLGATGIVRNEDYYIQRMNSETTFGGSLRAIRKRKPSFVNRCVSQENSASGSISSQSREGSSNALHASGDLQSSGDLDELNGSFVGELRTRFQMRPISRVSEGEESIAAASSTRSVNTNLARWDEQKDAVASG